MVGRPLLQGVDGVADDDIAAPLGRLDLPFDKEGPDAAPPHLVEIAVRIVVRPAHRHEERRGPQLARERARIGHDGAHLRVGPGKTAAHDGGDLR